MPPSMGVEEPLIDVEEVEDWVLWVENVVEDNTRCWMVRVERERKSDRMRYRLVAEPDNLDLEMDRLYAQMAAAEEDSCCRCC